MKETYTIPEAARRLEISEHQVKKLIKSWHLEVMEGGGKGNARLLRGEDVERVHVERVRTGLTRYHRQVATIDVPEFVDVALEASGIGVLPAGNLMDAVSAHHRDIRPIVVCTKERRAAEQMLFAAYAGDIDVIDWNDEVTLRDLVKRTWTVARNRIR